ncbi:MAG: cytochrome ubiquinol oxidase subunit I [Bacteroidia bacterium]
MPRFTCLAIPIETKKTYGIAIPGMLSLLTWGELNHEVAGLDKIPPEEWPNVGLVFQTYHGMVAIGMFLIGLTLFSLFLLWRNKLFEQKWLMKVFVISVIYRFYANQLGWISAEVGRQPTSWQVTKASSLVFPSVSEWFLIL